jgi:hypothetical protein
MPAPEIGYIALAAVTAGQFVQRVANSADGFPQVAPSSDGTTVGGELNVGVALADAAIGEFVKVAGPGEYATVTATGVLTPGTDHMLTTDLNGQAVAAGAGDDVIAIFANHVATVAGGDCVVFVLGTGVNNI